MSSNMIPPGTSLVLTNPAQFIEASKCFTTEHLNEILLSMVSFLVSKCGNLSQFRVPKVPFFETKVFKINSA